MTDIQVQVPEGSYGRVAPRSGLAVKNFIDVGAGVVDEDYRGNLGVVLFNHSDLDFEVKKGDRIAQFICERIFYPELEEVKSLTDTERGAGGFGSTGTQWGYRDRYYWLIFNLIILNKVMFVWNSTFVSTHELHFYIITIS